MTLQSVRAFVAVARAGSFGEAARLLDVSQPTVSGAVARLETHAGTKLFARELGGVSLTEQGQRVLGLAERLVRAADDLAEALTPAEPDVLHLGFMGEAASSVTGQIVRMAQQRLGRPVQLRRFDFDDPSCGLASGRSDLAIVWPPLTSDDVDQVVVTTDRRAVALPVADPLAGRDEVRPDELGDRHWVVPRSPDPAWSAFRHPRAIGVVPLGTVDSGSVEETLELVAAGAGVALFSVSTEQHYARMGVVIVPLTGDLYCTAALAWRRPIDRPVVADIVADIRAMNLPLR
ncbi:LysR family transcriptional regulator [Micromonospora sp. R77]|uniref:LysR family transcriptional regulator n=1 Tax=Micromonospora sp. R77 TaxID=2925836 RepID=UPI001F60944C|nr:LysR family transcriptional regulator [Micromonospora sp. R77]MCI4066887.1 LysR family transcriptional regulator [Micromonospora sp. R77]